VCQLFVFVSYGGGAGYVQIQLFKETAVMQAWCNFSVFTA